jgi:hypothetical protein
MSSERQLQDRGNSTKEDSLGIQDTQQMTEPAIIPTPLKNSDPQDNLEYRQRVDLLKKKLHDDLNSADTNATAN